MREFVEFVREKGVLGLAIGVVTGGAVTKLVNAIVSDVINPLIGLLTGKVNDLSTLAYTIPFTKIVFKWGDLLSNFIEFFAILVVVYVVFVKTPILSLDKKKEDK